MKRAKQATKRERKAYERGGRSFVAATLRQLEFKFYVDEASEFERIAASENPQPFRENLNSR